jgi:hypothetical protein
VPVQNFLNQRAVNVAVDGHYTLPNWYDPQGRLRTFPCRTTRVSPFRMIVEVPVVGKIGERLTSYFRDFGKLDCRISDTMERSFLLELEMSRERREKISDMLVWMEKRQKDPTVKCVRQHPRFVPTNQHSTLTLADGTVHPCSIIDASASGVAVSSPVQPPVGTPLAIGACVGRVIRLLPGGVAVKFVELQNPRALERLSVKVSQAELETDASQIQPATSDNLITV